MDTSGTAITTTVDSLKDDNIEDILLRLPSPASLARAALSSSRWRRVASSPDFLRRFRERRPSPPVLGLFLSQGDPGRLPVFHPSASVRSDPGLASAVRRGDFLLTRLEHNPSWRLRDCRNGRLLLCRDESLSVYDPVSHQHVAVPRRPAGPIPLARAEYIADCLLGGCGESFRIVSVQRHGPRLRAMEYRTGTPDWRCHPWVTGMNVAALRAPAMPAAAAGLIFWGCGEHSYMLLLTSTMTFSTISKPLALPNVESTEQVSPRPVYAIGDTEAGECCLVSVLGQATLQVWLLKKKCAGHTWELEKQGQIRELVHFGRPFRVHMVSAGIAVLCCTYSKYSHFVIDLKNLRLRDVFLCHRYMAYPFQMTWPPAGLVSGSTPQTYACPDAERQHEAPSSSRKRKSKDEMLSANETMEPSISIASLGNEPSEKKLCYEMGPPS